MIASVAETSAPMLSRMHMVRWRALNLPLFLHHFCNECLKPLYRCWRTTR